MKQPFHHVIQLFVTVTVMSISCLITPLVYGQQTCPIYKYADYGSYCSFYAVDEDCQNPSNYDGPCNTPIASCGGMPMNCFKFDKAKNRHDSFAPATGLKGLTGGPNPGKKNHTFDVTILSKNGFRARKIHQEVIQFDTVITNGMKETLYAKVFLVRVSHQTHALAIMASGCEIEEPPRNVRVQPVSDATNLASRICEVQVGSVKYQIVTETELEIDN